MGEYAIRKSDNTEVKIGTCEDMYYLRFEDRSKVQAIPRNVDPARDVEAAQLRFRLPFPDEDGIEIGQYKDHTRGERLYRPVKNALGAIVSYEDFTDPATANDPGTIQLVHKSGLLVNVPCYHGEKLPELGQAKVFWNGKSHSLELYQLRPRMVDGVLRVYPVVHCRFCGHAWRYDWSDVLEWIPEPMRQRLAVYAKGQTQVA
jgi:hypothetical protein